MSSLGEIQDYLTNLGDRISGLEGSGLGQVQVSEDATEDWLQVPFRFVTIASGAAALVTRTIAGDGPFDLIEISHVAVDSAGTVNDNFRVLIREGESVGRPLTMDGDFVDAANTSGTAQRPYIIKGRRRFRANIAIAVEVVNTTAAPLTNTIELVLHGLKVFTR
tara:strand:- start:185 stop:676 length:492 start_codon:yes stop_codon:yes gene_type:complete